MTFDLVQKEGQYDSGAFNYGQNPYGPQATNVTSLPKIESNCADPQGDSAGIWRCNSRCSIWSDTKPVRFCGE